MNGTASYRANATGARGASLLLNSATEIGGNTGTNIGAAGACTTGADMVRYLTAGDSIELQAYQSSGGALNVTGSLTVAALSA